MFEELELIIWRTLAIRGILSNRINKYIWLIKIKNRQNMPSYTSSDESLVYGELVVLGYSSYRILKATSRIEHNSNPKLNRKSAKWQPIGRPNAKFTLQRQKNPSGLQFQSFRSDCCCAMNSKGCDQQRNDLKQSNNNKKDSHCVFIPQGSKDAKHWMVEYVSDANTDMFQIGRLPDSTNDFIVPGPLYGESGTVSRHAARIICNRNPPYECMLFAGGFDSSKKLELSSKSLKYFRESKEWIKCRDALTPVPTTNREIETLHEDIQTVHEVACDALTKNGIRLWSPSKKKWYEVSVNGILYPINLSNYVRPATEKSNSVASIKKGAFNRPTTGPSESLAILEEGSILDLGGVQLQFQIPAVNKNVTQESILSVDSSVSELIAQSMEKRKLQCPIQLISLKFYRSKSDLASYLTGTSCPKADISCVPHVYPSCGHVFGYLGKKYIEKACPLCRSPGTLVQLLLKENSQLVGEGVNAVPDHVFNPCGHAVTERFAAYYSNLKMPSGRAICPFCAISLNEVRPYSKLYLYTK